MNDGGAKGVGKEVYTGGEAGKVEKIILGSQWNSSD